MRFKNVFCTQLYKDTFSKVLKQDEFTHGDEILVDMEEPDGDRISYIIMHHGHSISDCKAFVATTDENVLVAVFDLWGKFYKCYIIKNDSIKNVEVENVLGGKEIKFDGESQYGKISVKMSAVNRQFGTDLKFQRKHLQLFAANLQRISENPKCFIQDKDQVNSNNNIDSDEISIDLSLVELTDAQRRQLIGNRKFEDFNLESHNLNIIYGVYEANRDIVLTLTRCITPILTRDGGDDIYCILYKEKKYGVTYGYNWGDKKLNGIHNRTPFCQNVVESMVRYYEDSFHERSELEENVRKRFEKEYNMEIHDFLKFYVENVMDNS